MPKKPKPKHWSTIIEQDGTKIRIYERENSSSVWYSVKGSAGRKVQKSLGTSDREEAERRAREIARELTKVRLNGPPPDRLSVSRLRALYLHHRGPLLTPKRKKFVTLALGLFERHLGDDFDVGDFGQHWADAYVHARQSGKLKVADRRARKVGAGTVRNELHALSTVCNWATGFPSTRRPLLTFNPVRRTVKVPEEKNPARPIATKATYQALLTVADKADPTGRLRTLLVLAWETGRRVNAILHLRASDVLRTEDQVREALQGANQDPAAAEHWPLAVRWRREWDKCGYEDVAPLSDAARKALEVYLARNPKLGDAWIFPAGDGQDAMTKLAALHYLRRAEKLAGLTHKHFGGWHAFRRSWATRRKHLPVKDVMAAGGWRDVTALQKAYQHADPETIRRVMEAG